MRSVTFELSALHEHGSAFFDYLKLRKRFFVEQLGWDIPHDNRFEMDQYDNPTALYSLVIDEGDVLGGARVMPTSARWGQHTYMMGDAAQGALGSIPGEVMPEHVTKPDVWEMTRLVMCDTVTDQSDRRVVLQLVCDGCLDIVQAHDGRELRALSSLAMVRVLRNVGYPVDLVGSSWRDKGDGRRYSAMKMDIAPAHHAIAAQ